MTCPTDIHVIIARQNRYLWFSTYEMTLVQHVHSIQAHNDVTGNIHVKNCNWWSTPNCRRWCSSDWGGGARTGMFIPQFAQIYSRVSCRLSSSQTCTKDHITFKRPHFCPKGGHWKTGWLFCRILKAEYLPRFIPGITILSKKVCFVLFCPAL